MQPSIHPINRRRIVSIMPKEKDLELTFLFLKNVDERCPWASTVYEEDFDRRWLDDPANIAVFWKRLPRWLPFKTEASVGLVLVDEIPMPPFSPTNAEKFREFSRWSFRPEVVFTTYGIRDHIASVVKRLCTLPVSFYDPYSRHTQAQELLLAQKNTLVAVVGEMNEKRRKVTNILKAHFGQSQVIHADLWEDGFIEKVNQAKLALFIVEEQWSGLPFGLPSLMAMTGTPLITDSGDVFPLSGDEYIKIFLRNWDDSSELRNILRDIEQYAKSRSTGKTVAMKLANRMAQIASSSMVNDTICNEFGPPKNQPALEESVTNITFVDTVQISDGEEEGENA